MEVVGVLPIDARLARTLLQHVGNHAHFEVSRPGSLLRVEITVRPIGAGEGAMLRSVRLAALHDTPSAFGSTYDAEAVQPQEQWAERARQGSTGDISATFFATLGHRVIGLVAGYRPEPGGAAVELVSMWTAPEARRRGAARQLVQAVVEWASAGGAEAVELWVTDGNEPAIALYRSAGFEETGVHRRLPSDTSKTELRMRRPLRRT